jgi:peroxiredoxin
MRTDITPGGNFPDFELVDHSATPRRLSELQGNDPMIVVLARGQYCPKDYQQHVELAALYPKIAVGYTQIVTISTDDIEKTREFRASVGAPWTFLSDTGRRVQKELDIREYTDPCHDPMVPHTLVLKPRLVIHSLYNGYWFWGRPSTAELWRDLREATREIRPDWDLSASGLRAAWESGDRSRFFHDVDLATGPEETPEDPSAPRLEASASEQEVGAGLRDTDPPMPGELIYEYAPRITRTVEYGVSADAMFAGETPPSEGARLDLYLEGPVCAGKLNGTVRGVDYLDIRADGRAEVHIHAEIVTESGQNVALEAGGVAIRQDGTSLMELREHVSLRSNHAELAWVNGLEIWARGVVDVASGQVRLRAFSV